MANPSGGGELYPSFSNCAILGDGHIGGGGCEGVGGVDGGERS